MPRIRTIKPQFWLDENLGQIPRDVRLLYIGLWNLCDDQGVFEWRPSRIKIQLFPYDEDISGEDIGTWLEMLVGTGDIIQFENGTARFGYIKSFLEHQEIKNPSKWTFASIPEELTTSAPALTQPSPSTNPALPLGKRNREKEKLKGIGNKGNEGDLKDYIKELRERFPNLNFDTELERFNLYWSEGKRQLKRPKLALLNWMKKAEEISLEKAPVQRTGGGRGVPSEYTPAPGEEE
jgi:hypothetical protein